MGSNNGGGLRTKGVDAGRLQELRRQLELEEAENRKRLSYPPQALWAVLAECNAFFARLAAPWSHPLLRPGATEQANKRYGDLFPHSLVDLTQEAVRDRKGYRERIDSYEASVGRASIPFETNCSPYRTITRDPLRRQEEHFLLRALLDSRFLGDGRFRALDVGTGSGRLCLRMCRVLSECCSPDRFAVVGIDARPANVSEALGQRSRKPGSERAFFLAGDARLEPLRDGVVDLGCLGSVLHMVPVYDRPFLLLELFRVVRTGGEIVLTGPNEHFTGEQYVRWSVAHCPEILASVPDFFALHRFVQTGMLIADLVRTRADFRVPSTAELCATLSDTGCSGVSVDTWPGAPGAGTDFFTGIRCTVTEKTKQFAGMHQDAPAGSASGP